MRSGVVNLEEKEVVQGPKTEEESNLHMTTAAGSEDRVTTVTLADKCPASYLSNVTQNDCAQKKNVHDTGVANQARMVLIFGTPLGASSGRCLPASTFDGGGVSCNSSDAMTSVKYEKGGLLCLVSNASVETLEVAAIQGRYHHDQVKHSKGSKIEAIVHVCSTHAALEMRYKF